MIWRWESLDRVRGEKGYVLFGFSTKMEKGEENVNSRIESVLPILIMMLNDEDRNQNGMSAQENKYVQKKVGRWLKWVSQGVYQNEEMKIYELYRTYFSQIIPLIVNDLSIHTYFSSGIQIFTWFFHRWY